MAGNNPTAQEVHNQQLLEGEIRSMISKLTGHLTNLSCRAASGAGGEGADGGGMRVVTLAGTNKGATMEGRDMGDAHGMIHGDDGQLSAFANSNYQAVNNSILLEGSCTAEDPGVHLVITEHLDDDGAYQENPVKKEPEVEIKKTGGEEEALKKEQPVENGLNK
ncbi:hypothetical protein Taro_039174 [Colocasia esculenta]|uniref:Uncharacterized protein n=1 Tax=Colocasia esculenta TaxID=4460 RepID=A0A843WI27_COLES|nr:hypothetical protein [Colocasia esculenta]